MEEIVKNSIKELKRYFVPPSTIDLRLSEDQFATKVALTIVENAIKSGIMTEDEFTTKLKQ